MKRTSIFLVLLTFLALTDPVHAQILFQDDFNHGKSALWRQKNDGSMAASFHVAGGSYVIYSPDPSTSIPRAIVNGQQSSNFYLQATVNIAPGNAGLAEASLISY